MIYNYTIKPGQNLIDVAMQEYGSAEAVVIICKDNNKDVGSIVTPGTTIILDDINQVNKKLVAYYKEKNITVASE
jgi:hypothetical protein